MGRTSPDRKAAAKSYPLFTDTPFKNRSPIFNIGILEPSAPKVYTNPIKVARQYRGIIDSGLVSSQADLARHLGVSRAKITQMLNLFKLDEELQEFILGLEETDERLKILTERRLRSLISGNSW